MSKGGMSRRQFLGGAAVVAAASTVPVFSNLAPAMAAQDVVAKFPVSMTGLGAWVDLDATRCAREAYEIYRGKLAIGGVKTGQGG